MPNDTNNLPADLTPSLLGRWKVRILLLSVVVALAVGGAYLALQRRGASDTTDGSTNSAGTNTVRTTAQPVIRPEADRDGDRLNDQDEDALHTNPDNADTDGDGLFDYEEVRIWKTDARSPDTDGDLVRDGDEVRQGANPNGPGRYLDVNAALNNVNR